MLDILETKLAKGLHPKTKSVYTCTQLANHCSPQLAEELGIKTTTKYQAPDTYTVIMEKRLLWEAANKRLVQTTPVAKIVEQSETSLINGEIEVAIAYNRLELDQCLFCP